MHFEDDYVDYAFDPGGSQERQRQPPLCLRWETRGIWKILRTLLPCTEEEAAIAVDIVLNHQAGRPETSYSRDRSKYLAGDAPSRLHTYRRIVPAVDAMDEKGWIVHDRRRPAPRGCGWQSALAPKPELIEAVQSAIAIWGKLLPAKPTSPIVLRDAHGRPMSQPTTRAVQRMEAEVDAYNRFMLKADVSTGIACARRVFNGTLDRGGRWYMIGGAWQIMPAEERLGIEIAGESVVEVDYRAIHPQMLYAEAGCRMKGDPYDIDGWPRDLAKVAMLVLVNASDIEQACWSIAGKSAMSEVAEPKTRDAKKAAERLIGEIRSRHRAIEHAFCSDAGARLMRRDSEITSTVLKRMTEHGEACLPIHDSYIVRECAADLLEEVMKRAAHAAGIGEIELKKVVGMKGSGGVTEAQFLGLRPENVLTYPSGSSSSLSSSPLCPDLSPSLCPSPSFPYETPTPLASSFQDILPGERSSPAAPPKADDTTQSFSLSIPRPQIQEVSACLNSIPSDVPHILDTPQGHDVEILGTMLPRLSRSPSSIVLPTLIDPSDCQTHLGDEDSMSQLDLLASTTPSNDPETLADRRTSVEAPDAGKV